LEGALVRHTFSVPGELAMVYLALAQTDLALLDKQKQVVEITLAVTQYL
jgi:hypothetical protein